jgi:hypothetical protein
MRRGVNIESKHHQSRLPNIHEEQKSKGVAVKWPAFEHK